MPEEMVPTEQEQQAAPQENIVTHVEDVIHAAERSEGALWRILSGEKSTTEVVPEPEETSEAKPVTVVEETPTMPDETSTPEAATDTTTEDTGTSPARDLAAVACPSCGQTGGLLAADAKGPKGSTFAQCLKCSRRVVLSA